MTVVQPRKPGPWPKPALAEVPQLRSTAAAMRDEPPDSDPTLPWSEPRPTGTASRLRTQDPEAVLKRIFGLKAFRPHQRAVCDAVIAGRDALLVMPTGGGKSLCYQLPGIVRGGPTLVISPLIALMEDQVAKLDALGMRADRIHSGRDRSSQQAALRAWLDGELDFLMIAPERLRVPGFIPRLIRRPPALIAVDEAHCISMWGHDFRPDYRLLGERLPELRAGGHIPVVAMTATATVRVQQDIVTQLGMPEATRFIHGFRRDNLAVEVAECPQASRSVVAQRVLADKSLLPAVVYVLSRKGVDELVEQLRGTMRVAGYHAGMPAEQRARVQEGFQAGKLEVVVATVAFGMGIDKADIRCVLHLGLPGSIESWYQEIGRAGRDGLPSRVIALYSWADRHLHTHFFERSYPDPGQVASLLKHVPDGGIKRDQLLRKSGLPLEVAEAAIDKLWGHGAVTIDYDDQVHDATAAAPKWLDAYKNQRAHREAQLDDVFGLARAAGCRMRALIAYFGDRTDGDRPCGHCDHCDGETTVVRKSREPDHMEVRQLRAIVTALDGVRGPLSLGKLHREQFAQVDRKVFDRLLAGLERAGVVRTGEAAFEKDGQTIRYKTAELDDHEGLEDGTWLSIVRLEEAADAGLTPIKSKAKATAVRKAPTREALEAEADGRLVGELKAWRLARARLEGVPAYRVLTDATLLAIAAQLPRTADELLQVHGIGARLVEKYGRELLAELNR
jgi:RecQ family ATP-dependent DNA helicase